MLAAPSHLYTVRYLLRSLGNCSQDWDEKFLNFLSKLEFLFSAKRKANYVLRTRQNKGKAWPLYLHICFGSHSKGDLLLKTSGNWYAFWRMWKNNIASQEPQQDGMTPPLGSAVMIKEFRGGSVVFWISSTRSSALRFPYLFLAHSNKETFVLCKSIPFFLVENITYLDHISIF